MRAAINIGSIRNDESLIGYVCAMSGLDPNTHAGSIYVVVEYTGVTEEGVLLVGKKNVFY